MTTTAIMPRKRDVPWLGVGTTGEWVEVTEALHDSELDYRVKQSVAYDRYGNELPGVLVNHNVTTGEIVGVTSDRYGVVQNADAFSMLDPFCKAGGVIEHAGMTVNGMCFMVMRMPGMAFGFMDDDFELYVCAMNSFNTKFPLAIIITPVRVYCQNMFRKLMVRSDTVLMIKHGRFAMDRMLSVSRATTLLLDYTTDFKHALSSAMCYERTDDDVRDFVEVMMPLVPETAEHPRAALSNERIRQQREQFFNDYYMAPDNEMYRDTSLGIINAYYDWITHYVPMRASGDFSEIRFGNLMNGVSVNRKLVVRA